MDACSTVIGFVLGIIGSLMATMCWAHMVRPQLHLAVEKPKEPGALWHLLVANTRRGPNDPLWPQPETAWACTCTVSVNDPENQELFSFPARWTSQPEPIVPGLHPPVLDMAKLIDGRRTDVYAHVGDAIPLVFKLDGESHCWFFANESYAYYDRKNPAWRLDQGKFRVRITLHSSRGNLVKHYIIINRGSASSGLVLHDNGVAG